MPLLLAARRLAPVLLALPPMVAMDAARAQAPVSEIDPNATAIRCELHTIRAPDATQMLYFYISDARRTVYETDGNVLGNVVRFGPQRIVVSRNQFADGGVRNFVFDRMVGSLTVTLASPSGGRDGPWAMSGACLKVDASRAKF